MFYKLVFRRYDRLESVCRNREIVPEKYLTIYEVGEWTLPKVSGTKLFVFNSFEAAKNFREYTFSCENLPYVECWSCEVEKPVDAPEYIVGSFSDDIEAFWNTYVEGKEVSDEIANAETPDDTIFVSKVKLLERLI